MATLFSDVEPLSKLLEALQLPRYKFSLFPVCHVAACKTRYVKISLFTLLHLMGNHSTVHFHVHVSRIHIHDLSFTRRALYSAPLNDGQWHHICVTWRNSDGKWVFFVDGFGRISGDALATNHVIKSNGRFVVGQAQLSFGGSFNSSESFVGEISQLNVWGSASGKLTVKSIFANSSSKESGDTLDWRDILANVIGEVLIKKPSGQLGGYVLNLNTDFETLGLH